MAMRSNFMADLAQMVNGAASAFGGMREEIAARGNGRHFERRRDVSKVPSVQQHATTVSITRK